MAAIVTKPVWQLFLAITLCLMCLNAFIGLGALAIAIPIGWGISGVLMLLGI
jgi:hypothetical protein